MLPPSFNTENGEEIDPAEPRITTSDPQWRGGTGIAGASKRLPVVEGSFMDKKAPRRERYDPSQLY